MRHSTRLVVPVLPTHTGRLYPPWYTLVHTHREAYTHHGTPLYTHPGRLYPPLYTQGGYTSGRHTHRYTPKVYLREAIPTVIHLRVYLRVYICLPMYLRVYTGPYASLCTSGCILAICLPMYLRVWEYLPICLPYLPVSLLASNEPHSRMKPLRTGTFLHIYQLLVINPTGLFPVLSRMLGSGGPVTVSPERHLSRFTVGRC